MSPSLEDLAPVAPAVNINVDKSFAYGPSVIQPALKFNGEPLEAGTFRGFGFNTIFRPASRRTQTPFPKPPEGVDSNVLQLNLTGETQVFGEELGNIPNRGLFDQPDIDLVGIPYTQTIIDAMPPLEGEKAPKNHPVLHFEPGLWMRVPEVEVMPKLSASFCRMGSIPHGTTINAQGFQPSITTQGAPDIPSIDITPIFPFPFPGNSFPGKSPRTTDLPTDQPLFSSQDAHKDNIYRLPQDLGPFIANGTITQDILNDPNKILRDANEGKDIIENTMFVVSTNAPPGAFGGGTSNIGFNIGADAGLGSASPESNSGNANAVDVIAQYWVSKIRAQVQLDPSMKVGDIVSPVAQGPRDAVPEFFIDDEVTIPSTSETVTVAYTQIQYSQSVSLDFHGLKWPHVTIATLAPIVHLEKPTLSSAIKEAGM
ncbi:unnamed protein product [Fusarium equiseti]|uniref:Uncharacterized protein n=1 Tax=Fusarium equiseti TaxID=61235 RepID=A0A8J2ILS8_FUSEQ|nr:unnamed protein product [Fusarium equiseti]